MAGNTSPLMQQYREARQQHPNAVVLFRIGDFFELFEQDAEVGARVLGLSVTSRDGAVPMAGFPHHALEGHLLGLVRAGHSVAVCDQVEEAGSEKGLLRREVVRVVTPGTATAEELLDPLRAHHLAAVWPSGDLIGLAWADLSTGAFQAMDTTWSDLANELDRLAPTECLYLEDGPAPLHGLLASAVPGMTLTARPDWTFDPRTTRAALLHFFKVLTPEGFGFAEGQPCLTAAAALLLFVKDTCKASLAHLRRPRPYRAQSHLLLDEATRRSLELTRTLRDGKREGSLLAHIDRTVTPMGARLLQESLLAPLTDRAAIEARLDAVAEFVDGEGLRRQLRETVARVPDLHRLGARVSSGKGSPRDLLSVARALRALPEIRGLLSRCRARLLGELERHLETCPELCQHLAAALSDNPPADAHEGGVIREGFDAALDELRQTARSGKEWLARFQAEEATRTGIGTLKVGYTQVFGYYIEVGHAHAKKVPTHYQRQQTLKNAERYTTPELKQHEEQVLSAEEQIRQREVELVRELRERVAGQAGRLQRAGEVLARLDVLAGLAELAASRGYCRPEFTEEPLLEIEQGRHPVLDQTLPPGTFVPNDVMLGPDQGHFWLITGPNLAGKSTFIRQVALLTLLAQMGSFIPACRARLGIVDRIFARVGASDDLSRGHSTFMVEMVEAANILNNATARSLVILDEIGRGTSTYDGVSLAWAITEYLHDRIGCRALFATHYHELTRLADSLAHLRNYTVRVQESPEGITFLHRIEPGSVGRSYGIHVARLAGVPPAVLQRAEDVLQELERNASSPRTSKASCILKAG